jgi:MFS family permease
LVVGLFVASTLIGRRVTRTGRYKRYMLTGTGLLTAGLALMGTLDETTSLAELAGFMILVGAGVGMLMQNLVLVVQNSVTQREIGAGSALVAFSRSLGGAIGVSVLGALLAAKASSSITAGLAGAGIHASGGDASQVPSIAALPPAIARIVEHAYGTGIAEVFLSAAPLGLVAMAAIALIREVPLGTQSGTELARQTS